MDVQAARPVDRIEPNRRTVPSRQAGALADMSSIVWTAAILAFIYYVFTGKGAGTARKAGKWSFILLGAAIAAAVLFGFEPDTESAMARSAQ